eukprot:gene27825-54273_t
MGDDQREAMGDGMAPGVSPAPAPSHDPRPHQPQPQHTARHQHAPGAGGGGVAEELKICHGHPVAKWTRGRLLGNAPHTPPYGVLLGKGGFARCYEVTNEASGQVLAAEVSDETHEQ